MSSLIYSEPESIKTNILLIDVAVNQHEIFYNSVNSNTYPILFNTNSLRDDLIVVLEMLKNNGMLGQDIRMAIVQHDGDIGTNKLFLNNEPFFVDNDLLADTQPSDRSPNIQFLMNLITQYNITNLDFLACNTLQYPRWRQFYDLFNGLVVIGASDDLTGNILYSADWVLENMDPQLDIRDLYWTDQIEHYSGTLSDMTGSNKSTNTNGVTKLYILKNGSIVAKTDTTVDYISITNKNNWPFTISTTSATYNIYIEDGCIYDYNLSAHGTTNRIIQLASNGAITVNVYPLSDILVSGSSSTATIYLNNIPSAAAYTGFFAKSSATVTINVYRINFDFQTSVLATGCGWIFGYKSSVYTNKANCNAYDCSTNGSVPASGGGIIGSGFSTSNATRCYSTGTLATGSGGIFGASVVSGTASYCFSNGLRTLTTFTNCGGIFGTITSTSVITMNYCYCNTMKLLGSFVTNATVTITSSYCNSSTGIGAAPTTLPSSYYEYSTWDSPTAISKLGSTNCPQLNTDQFLAIYKRFTANIWMSIGMGIPFQLSSNRETADYIIKKSVAIKYSDIFTGMTAPIYNTTSRYITYSGSTTQCYGNETSGFDTMISKIKQNIGDLLNNNNLTLCLGNGTVLTTNLGTDKTIQQINKYIAVYCIDMLTTPAKGFITTTEFPNDTVYTTFNDFMSFPFGYDELNKLTIDIINNKAYNANRNISFAVSMIYSYDPIVSLVETSKTLLLQFE